MQSSSVTDGRTELPQHVKCFEITLHRQTERYYRTAIVVVCAVFL